MNATQDTIKLDQATVSLGGREVLKNVSLTVTQGEHLVIIGTGGSGKSTLLKAMAGIIPCQSGRVELFGETLSSLKEREILKLRKKVGVAFQQGALFDFMTVGENIRFALGDGEKETKEIKDKICAFLERVKLAGSYDKFPSELSGGMRRRVGIVRALIHSPTLLLLDEPTAGLDPVATTIIINMIQKLAEEHKATIVCVASASDIAMRFQSRIALLHEGSVSAVGTMDELLANPDPLISKFLLARQNPILAAHPIVA